MAYYGNYGGQLPTQLGGQAPYQADFSGGGGGFMQPGYGYNACPPNGVFSQVQPGLAGYGGVSYRGSQPTYYTGPSYSTTSDNDLVGNLPLPGYPAPYGNMSSYGMQNYAAPPNFATPSYVSQPAYAMPNYTSDPYGCYPPGPPVQAQPYPAQQSFTQHQSATMSQVQQGPQGQDDLAQLAPQIEAAYEAATGQRRQPVIKRQVITIPGTPGRVQQVVRRLPTPTPDIVERVFIVKPQRDVVNLVIERPGTPPAQYKDRTILGRQRRPVIQPRIVRVAARSQYQYQPLSQYQLPVSVPQYQISNYVQALPPPSPVLNVQTVRTAPSGYYMPQQPALSGQQFQTDLSQGHLSQAHLSQAQLSQPQLSQPSQSQLPQQLSQHQLAQPQFPATSGLPQIAFPKSSYIVAPVQYDDTTYLGANGYNGLANYGGSPIQPGFQQVPLQQIQPVPLQTPIPIGGPQPTGGPFGGYGSGYGGYSTGFPNGGFSYGGSGGTPPPSIGTPGYPVAQRF